MAESTTHTAAQSSVAVTIAKADIKGVTLSDQGVDYDGKVHGLALKGELPKGVTVTYENNAQTEPGTYRVKATLNGGNNYKSTTLEATLTIGEKPGPTPTPGPTPGPTPEPTPVPTQTGTSDSDTNATVKTGVTTTQSGAYSVVILLSLAGLAALGFKRKVKK